MEDELKMREKRKKRLRLKEGKEDFEEERKNEINREEKKFENLKKGRNVSKRKDMDWIGWKIGGLKKIEKRIVNGRRGMRRIREEKKDEGIERIEEKREGIGGKIGEDLIDEKDKEKRSEKKLDMKEVGEVKLGNKLKKRVGKCGNGEDKLRNRVNERLVESKKVKEGRGNEVILRIGKIKNVGLKNIGERLKDWIGRGIKRIVIMIDSGNGERRRRGFWIEEKIRNKLRNIISNIRIEKNNIKIWGFRIDGGKKKKIVEMDNRREGIIEKNGNDIIDFMKGKIEGVRRIIGDKKERNIKKIIVNEGKSVEKIEIKVKLIKERRKKRFEGFERIERKRIKSKKERRLKIEGNKSIKRIERRMGRIEKCRKIK